METTEFIIKTCSFYTPEARQARYTLETWADVTLIYTCHLNNLLLLPYFARN